MSVGERIKQRRTELGWSRRRLSEETRVPYQTLASLEAGDQKGSTALPTIAAALGVDPVWLQSGRRSGAIAAELAPFVPAALEPLERQLLKAFRELPASEQQVIVRMVRGLTASGEP